MSQSTARLYWSDAYLSEFDAHLIAQTTVKGQPAVALTASAFYPTGGGQPADSGLLNGVAVTDVQDGDGQIWHLLETALAAGPVHGQVNWERRFDHMQQHTGQHILSQAFISACQAATVAFHLGEQSTTIDLDQAALTPDDLDAAERLANQVIAQNLPVTARFVSAEELAALPLRRPPKVTDRVRIVEISRFDWSACGGTHVRQTAEVGQIKITRLDRRGAETRIEFLCGQRALADYGRKQGAVQALMKRLSTSEDDLPAAVDRLAEQLRQAQRRVRQMRTAVVETEAARLWAAAQPHGALRLVHAHLPAWAPDDVKTLANTLRQQPGCVAVLTCETNAPAGGQLFCAAAADVTLDMGSLLQAAVQVAGVRGGGRGAWAQASANSSAQLQYAFETVIETLMKQVAA